jgi:hypothetical protein
VVQIPAGAAGLLRLHLKIMELNKFVTLQECDRSGGGEGSEGRAKIIIKFYTKN